MREQFLSELDLTRIRDLDDFNARLWAWLDQIYHVNPHSSLDGLSSLERYCKDLLRIRPLGAFAGCLDELFHPRHPRKVRKDGTVTFQAKVYEVRFELVAQTVVLVVDRHADRALTVESARTAKRSDRSPRSTRRPTRFASAAARIPRPCNPTTAAHAQQPILSNWPCCAKPSDSTSMRRNNHVPTTLRSHPSTARQTNPGTLR
ncbi:MAG: hypothetical protein ACRERS_06815 [Methylococcales bacterium]